MGFYGGVHPKTNKEKTANLSIIENPLPKKVIVPLLQHTGSMCEPTVKTGDEVSVGTKIGISSKFISSPIHSSVSGRVISIEEMPHPVVGRCLSIIIESDGKDARAPSVGVLRDYNNLSKEEILKIIQESGIVGLGGAMFPTHVKLIPPADKPIDSVIINGVECEPYITCDHALMREKPKEIIEGLRVIMKILDVKRAFIAIESNKQDAIQIMKKNLNGLLNIEVIALKVKYPQGAEKQLIKAILNREVPSGKLPFDVGVIVQNVQTAFSIYEALSHSKPLYERVVTFSGGALKNPANLRVRIGTPIKEVVEFLGGVSDNLSRIVFGGPMMGIAQFTTDVPIIKGTSSVLFFTDKEIFSGEYGCCIRCGRCIEACPAKIMPANLGLAVESLRYDIALEFSPLDCFECGVCSYICPTKRPLLHFIKLAKLKARQVA
ncbi:MAG: electron transport complex subunit RsxC [Candidatus Omnitrophica bacterium]|nr:electron transport complex subunit RsxC [Candidatus Omnitrophota bacterium]